MNTDKHNEESVVTEKTSAVIEKKMTPLMSIGDWIVTLLLLAIPIVNIVMVIIWLSNKNTNQNKKNYIISYIIFFVIGLIVWGILTTMIMASLGEARNRAIESQQAWLEMQMELSESSVDGEQVLNQIDSQE